MPESKPSYKSMIITAISSRNNFQGGVSRQSIAKYLQENSTASSGSRFNSALRRTLQSGTTSGLLSIEDSEQRYKLTEPQIHGKSEEQNRRIIVEKKRFHDALMHQTRTATKHNELFKLLTKSISLSKLQRIIGAEINCMDIDKARNVHYHCLPIHDLLPDDVMQNILSFDDGHVEHGEYNQHKSVCQKWKCLIMKNEENALRAMYQSLQDRHPNWSLNDNNTWVMHATRRRLHPIEQQLGLRGVLRNFEDINRKCRNIANCRVLIHPGQYNGSDCKLTQNVHFVGVSTKQSVEISGRTTITNATIVTLENVCFQPFDSLFVQEDSKIILKNTRMIMNYKSCLKVETNASLEMHHCRLDSRGSPMGRGGKTAIYISPWANQVHISNNTFNDFYHSVAVMHDRVENDTLAMIKVTNNKFMLDEEQNQYYKNLFGNLGQGWTIHGKRKQVVELVRPFRDVYGNVLIQQPQMHWTGRCLLVNNRYCPRSSDPSDANTMKFALHDDWNLIYKYL